MTQLIIGRIAITNLRELNRSTAADSDTVTFKGRLFGSMLEDVMTIRDELQALAAGRQIVAITLDTDSRTDGFYRLVSGSVQVGHLFDPFMFDFLVDATRLGTDGDLMFRSKLVGTVAQNDHGITEAEAAPFHAIPSGAYGYNPGSTVPTFVTRTGAEAVRVFRDVDFAVDPWWSVAAADFYDGGAFIEIGGPNARSGVTAPNFPNDWQLSNNLIRVSPNGTGGRIDMEVHDGAVWETAKVWRIQSGGTDVGQWDAVRILRNAPEECAIRLTRDVAAGGEITLDLTLRRGSRFVTGYLTRHASATLKVVLATAEVGQTVTPTGASSAVGIERTTNDSDGNRYIIGSARSFTNDLTNGGLSKASTTTLDFFVGSEVDGSSAQSGDTSEDLCLQYLGVLAEHLIGAPR